MHTLIKEDFSSCGQIHYASSSQGPVRCGIRLPSRVGLVAESEGMFAATGHAGSKPLDLASVFHGRGRGLGALIRLQQQPGIIAMDL